MKKLFAYLFVYPILTLVFIVDKVFDSVEALFGGEGRIQELEDRVKELENK